mmetsp:Transcript_18521/g.42241  ORF Transcript_18521/g.42241 Transcript_18521/m.42241 type:complete len:207 (-) Transcript_18521:465-1085(-)
MFHVFFILVLWRRSLRPRPLNSPDSFHLSLQDLPVFYDASDKLVDRMGFFHHRERNSLQWSFLQGNPLIELGTLSNTMKPDVDPRFVYHLRQPPFSPQERAYSRPNLHMLQHNILTSLLNEVCKIVVVRQVNHYFLLLLLLLLLPELFLDLACTFVQRFFRPDCKHRDLNHALCLEFFRSLVPSNLLQSCRVFRHVKHILGPRAPK